MKESPDIADAQLAARGSPGVLGHTNRMRAVLKQGARLSQERSTGFGKLDASFGAIEERDSQFSLELADLPAQRRLGHPKRARSFRKVQFLRNADEVAQLAKFHLETIPCCDSHENKEVLENNRRVR